MSEVKHTPTPYEVVIADGCVPLICTRGLDIAVMVDFDEDTDEAIPSEANAAFMAQACNAHGDLVRLLCRFYEGAENCEYVAGFAQEEFNALMDEADALLNSLDPARAAKAGARREAWAEETRQHQAKARARATGAAEATEARPWEARPWEARP